MTAYLGFSNLDNWDQALDIDTKGPTGEWVPLVSLARGAKHELHVGDGQEIICRIRLGKKGEDYGRFLGELSQLVVSRGRGAADDKSLGQLAYETYSKEAGGKSLATGAPLPEWDDVKPDIKRAWEATGKAVVRGR